MQSVDTPSLVYLAAVRHVGKVVGVAIQSDEVGHTIHLSGGIRNEVVVFDEQEFVWMGFVPGLQRVVRIKQVRCQLTALAEVVHIIRPGNLHERCEAVCDRAYRSDDLNIALHLLHRGYDRRIRPATALVDHQFVGVVAPRLDAA